MTTGAVRDTSTEVFAVLRHEDTRWMGRMLPVTSGPPRFTFPRERGIDRVPLGTFLTLGIASRAMGRTAQCPARLMAVELAHDSVAIEVQLEDPGLWREAVPDRIHEATNRRAWPRVRPGPGQEDRLEVILGSGAASGRRLAGWRMNTSPGGVAVRLPRQAEDRLCRCDRMAVSDGSATGPQRHGVVRHRRLLPVGVRYGLAFREGPPAETRYEPQWTCAECDADPLLAESQRFCPACGGPRRDQPTRLPDWDDLVAARDHPFTGLDRTCLRCGCAWGADARNCGHCGTRLPRGSEPGPIRGSQR